jgi:predicted metal-dependent hydrolase
VNEIAEPALLPDERVQLAKGVAEFNDGLYFECHDTLEELWSGIRGPSRDFFQGLIQVSVGLYHFGNDNREGARSMFERALKRLEKYPARYAGFEVEAERRRLRAWHAALSASSALAIERPSWRFEEPAAS